MNNMGSLLSGGFSIRAARWQHRGTVQLPDFREFVAFLKDELYTRGVEEEGETLLARGGGSQISVTTRRWLAIHLGSSGWGLFHSKGADLGARSGFCSSPREG